MVVKSVSPTLLLKVYHPLKLKKVFQEEFAELLSNIPIDYNCIVFSGNLNIHIDEQKTKPQVDYEIYKNTLNRTEMKTSRLDYMTQMMKTIEIMLAFCYLQLINW